MCRKKNASRVWYLAGVIRECSRCRDGTWRVAAEEETAYARARLSGIFQHHAALTAIIPGRRYILIYRIWEKKENEVVAVFELA